jgi:peptidoglycan-N-acetylglucosamine deacetylase
LNDSPRDAAPWPAGHRSALCVSIDVDGRYGEANSRAAEETYWLSQTAYDPTGTVRLLNLLADFGVQATFCWVGRVAEEQPVLLRRCVADGHEIALHTWDHRPYNRLSRQEQAEDMQKTLAALQRLGGVAPAGHKTGGWRFDEHTFALAQELGLAWVMDEPGGDLPYFVQPDPTRPPLVQLPPSRLWDDYTFFVDQTVTPQATFEFWREDLDVLRDDGGLMCLTLHPFVTGRPAPSRALARLLDYAIDLGDVWIARADQIAAWWTERAQA